MKEKKPKEIRDLKKMSGLKSAKLVSTHSYKEIADAYNCSESTSRKILAKKAAPYLIFYISSPKDAMIPAIERQSYSDNEMDYPSVFKDRVLITREGILSFDGNKPLIGAPSQLSRVAIEYHRVMKLNNIKI
jgi:hypothetical protein